METDLIFDTETTGLIDFNAPADAPHQPRIIQLGALLVGPEGHVIAQMNAFIKPDGWVVPEVVVKLTGITTEQCERVGIPMPQALAIFNAMKAVATTRVAHNLQFDKMMLAREASVYNIPHDSAGIKSFCTMNASTRICKIAPTEKMIAAGFKTFKKPNLQEAYTHFHGKPFEGTHDAMADVHACKDIYFKLKAAYGGIYE